MDPKIKNFNATFHTCSAANEFTRKLLKKYTKLHFFTENKKQFHTKKFFQKNKKLFHKITTKVHKNRTLGGGEKNLDGLLV